MFVSCIITNHFRRKCNALIITLLPQVITIHIQGNVKQIQHVKIYNILNDLQKKENTITQTGVGMHQEQILQ